MKFHTRRLERDNETRDKGCCNDPSRKPLSQCSGMITPEPTSDINLKKSSLCDVEEVVVTTFR